MHTVSQRGIAYSLTPGAEPTLVFVHGLAGYRDEWQPVVSRLRVDNRVVLLDLRGHGDSAGATGADLVGEVVADLAHLRNETAIERCVLLGQSLGGLIVLQSACRMANIEGLVLIEAGTRPITSDALIATQSWLERFPDTFPDANTAGSFFGGSALRQSVWTNGLAHDRSGYHPRFDRNTARALITAFGAADQLSSWAHFPGAALLIVATQGRIPEAEINEMLTNRPSTRLVRLHGGHDVHLDQPAAVAHAIATLVAEQGWYLKP